MKTINKICCKCNSDKIDAFSIKKIIANNKKYEKINITYICQDCGNMDLEIITIIH
ncbi:hypothetical protein [Clostridium septicum]|uniref:Uncharacterized protein n=1 Tax=Clostridium septicum TaxID=1504 RepID=A0ABY5B535_CLOSE|nr:hypothetical protein [Clostridium septicum]UEC20050.1 hypothetical protein LK444_11625 [Clostridium septicum]USS01894.1 hypothetical protein NH397_05545 [Clostridium septicum]